MESESTLLVRALVYGTPAQREKVWELAISAMSHIPMSKRYFRYNSNRFKWKDKDPSEIKHEKRKFVKRSNYWKTFKAENLDGKRTKGKKSIFLFK